MDKCDHRLQTWITNEDGTESEYHCVNCGIKIMKTKKEEKECKHINGFYIKDGQEFCLVCNNFLPYNNPKNNYNDIREEWWKEYPRVKFAKDDFDSQKQIADWWLSKFEEYKNSFLNQKANAHDQAVRTSLLSSLKKEIIALKRENFNPSGNGIAHYDYTQFNEGIDSAISLIEEKLK